MTGPAGPTLHVVGHFGGRNFGDELMLDGVRTLARRVGCGEPRVWKLNGLRPFAQAIARERSGSLVVAAGSSFHDLYPTGRLLRQQVAKAAYVAFASAARSVGMPVVFIGSLGPSWHPTSSGLDAAMARLSTTLLLRDHPSLEHAAGLVGAGRVHLAPDLAEAVLASIEPSRHRSERRRLLVCPTTDRLVPGWVHPMPEPLVAAASHQGFEELTLLRTYASTARDRDDDALGRFADAGSRHRLRVRVVSHDVSGPEACHRTILEIAAHDVVVAARLHPALVALHQQLPTILAPYHPKVLDVTAAQFGDAPRIYPTDAPAAVATKLRQVHPRHGVVRLTWDDRVVDLIRG